MFSKDTVYPPINWYPSTFLLYAWCARTFTSICFGSKQSPGYPTKIRILPILNLLITHPPPLRSLNLASISDNFPKVYSALSIFLQKVRTSFEEVTTYHSEPLFNCLMQTTLPHLVSVTLKFERKEAISARSLLHHFAKSSPHFSRLSVKFCHKNYNGQRASQRCLILGRRRRDVSAIAFL